MISYIKGVLAEAAGDSVVVEAGSMGFEVHVPLSVLEKLPRVGEEVKLHTYFQVREDAMTLYGFLTRQDLEMYKLLITVNGIGPKAALGILSALRPDDLRLAILSGDVKAISRAPGVGTKTAQRVILDLKDRVHIEDLQASDFTASGEQTTGMESAGREAVEALIALGYSPLEASRAVKKAEVTDGMTPEAVLKASLKQLSFL